MEKAKDFWHLQNKTNKNEMKKSNAISFCQESSQGKKPEGAQAERVLLQIVHCLQEGKPGTVQEDGRPCSQHHQNWGGEGEGIKRCL